MLVAMLCLLVAATGMNIDGDIDGYWWWVAANKA